MAQARRTPERSRGRRDSARSARGAAAGAASILAWQDDPGEPTAARQPISRPAPNLGAPPLPISIRGRAPAPREFKLGTPGFRYWANAEAVARGAAFWASILPSGTT